MEPQKLKATKHVFEQTTKNKMINDKRELLLHLVTFWSLITKSWLIYLLGEVENKTRCSYKKIILFLSLSINI